MMDTVTGESPGVIVWSGSKTKGMGIWWWNAEGGVFDTVYILFEIRGSLEVSRENSRPETNVGNIRTDKVTTTKKARCVILISHESRKKSWSPSWCVTTFYSSRHLSDWHGKKKIKARREKEKSHHQSQWGISSTGDVMLCLHAHSYSFRENERPFEDGWTKSSVK